MSTAVRHDLLPGVAVRVVQHVLASGAGAVGCWTYITQGLRAHGQQEIVFTHVRPGHATAEEAPRGPLQLLATVARFAQEGRLVAAGGLTELGPGGLFGIPALRGVVYEHAWPMSGVEVPHDALAAIALVDPEMDVAKRYGSLRVLARIGRAHAFFPTAPWCDPRRNALMPRETHSVLEGVASASPPGAWVTIEGDRVLVRLSRATQPSIMSFVSRLPPDAAVALFGRLAPEADACLVWSPGQKAPEAISAPGGQGAAVAANFILFVAEQNADAVSIFEDGVTAVLSNASWSRIRDALTSGTALTLPPQEPRSRALAIEWH